MQTVGQGLIRTTSAHRWRVVQPSSRALDKYQAQ